MTKAQKRWGISRRTSITIGVVGVILLTLVRLDAFRDLRHGMKNSDSFASFVTSNLRLTSEPEATGSSWDELEGVSVEDYPTPDIPHGAVEHRVKRIVDGDTLHLRDGTKVRLHGIDTPERDQPYGKQATGALDRLLKTKIFVLEKDTDRYGRLIGVLYTPEGLNVNLEMVCGGHAWWYERYARFDSDLEDCQESAQDARLGLWAYEDAVAPWEWRRR